MVEDMSYRIVVDSCGEFTEKMKGDPHFVHVALRLNIEFVDDDTFDRLDFLKKMKASPNCPKSSCPSPEAYREAYDCGAEHLYAVTLSGELSGSCNSAELGRNLYLERSMYSIPALLRWDRRRLPLRSRSARKAGWILRRL